MASTYTEIMSQPSVWKKILDKTNSDIPWINNTAIDPKSVLYFVGCGTSYYLALVAASVYSRLTGRCARAVTSSDLLFFPEAITFDEHVRAITISRSGETTETVWATEHLVKKGIPTFALTCQSDSSLARHAHVSYVVEDANEHSIVMTRSFTGMLLFLQKFAALNARDTKFIDQLNRLPAIGERIIEQHKNVIRTLAVADTYTFVSYLGQGAYYGIASESMLKLKEMALTNTEVFHTLEFRHGPKSVADENSLIIILMSESAEKHEIKLAMEIKQQGASVVVIAESIPSEIKGVVDLSICLGSGLSEYARLNLLLPLTQLFAYERALGKGIDPDNPVNLTKVVML
jgi:glutamine---fructose-6-phosphate transaminase (isomerizing)